MNDGKLILAGKDPTKPAINSPQIGVSEGGKMMLRLSSRRLVHQEQTANGTRLARPKNVLDEDKYSRDLQSIIQRDYFSGKEQPRTPKMSLDRYQANFTSEDNNDFNDLLEKEIDKKRAKYAVRKLPKSGPRQHLIEGTNNEVMEISDRNKYRQLGWLDERLPAVESWSSSEKNALMFRPEEYHHQPVSDKRMILKSNVHAPDPKHGNQARRIASESGPGPGASNELTINSYGFVTKSMYNIPDLSSREKLGHRLTRGRDALKPRVENGKAEKGASTPAGKRIMQRMRRKV